MLSICITKTIIQLIRKPLHIKKLLFIGKCDNFYNVVQNCGHGNLFQPHFQSKLKCQMRNTKSIFYTRILIKYFQLFTSVLHSNGIEIH